MKRGARIGIAVGLAAVVVILAAVGLMVRDSLEPHESCLFDFQCRSYEGMAEPRCESLDARRVCMIECSGSHRTSVRGLGGSPCPPGFSCQPIGEELSVNGAQMQLEARYCMPEQAP